MAVTGQSRRVARFGVFETDLQTGELHRQGIRIRLQQQPFLVLAVLLERAGEVVSREELRKTLWPDDTFVDFDLGLDAAIYKLRQALGDTAENPRFVETLSRRGYRFLTPVTFVEPSGAAAPDGGTHAPVASTLAGPAEAQGFPTTAKDGSVAAGTAPDGVAPSRASRRRPAILVWIGVTLSAAVVLAAAAYWWPRPGPGVKEPVIAVLPFTDLEPTGNTYFADGLTDEIIRNLSVIEGLQVRSRTSSFAFKGKPRNLPEVGAMLHANLVLEGSVLRVGDRLRINAQLIRVADDQPLWSGRYDRKTQDVFLIQDEISRAIVNQLRLKLGGGKRRYDLAPETYEAYLKARGLSQRIAGRPGRGGVETALELYQQVVARNPDFAPAYAGIGTSYAALSVSQRFSPVSAEDAYGRMRQAATRALELDPLLAEAHVTMGLVHQRDLAWAEAGASFRRAVELDPNSWPAHAHYGMYLFAHGRKDEAAREAERLAEIDPLAAESYLLRTLVYLSRGQSDAAIRTSRHMLELEPEHGIARQFLARALTQQGRPDEAVQLLQGRTGSEHFLGYALARAGRREEAERLAARLRQWPNVVAPIYAGLGDKARTLEALERMAALKDVRTDIYPHFPEFAFLKDDPRMLQLRHRRGLPWP
jgi:TolB-like protein/DNA-binding winged helix-turn-helix (wHTH) protein/Tfp pilus assembly protein PilF